MNNNKLIITFSAESLEESSCCEPLEPPYQPSQSEQERVGIPEGVHGMKKMVNLLVSKTQEGE
jgi:hypothetical protein